MRYAPEHKHRTRERILTAARRLFRRDGYDDVSLDALMAAAGLTRGGFYKHFRSKADLFAETLGGEADFVTRMKAREGDDRESLARGALAVVCDYLHPNHRDQVGRGCDMASLSVDIARASKRARRRHTANLRALVAEFERGLPDAEPPDPRALAAVALCVGGLTLSRALDDEELATALLGGCELAVSELLTGTRATRRCE